MNGVATAALAVTLTAGSTGTVHIEPRGGPVGTEVALRMGGLPAETALVIGFGAPREGYEWIGAGESDGAGVLSATLRVPAWSEENALHYFFVALPDRPPLGTSPGFHVTAPDGTLSVSGELVGDPGPGRSARLRGAFDEIYCVSPAPVDARPGARVTVEGVLGAPGDCPDGIPVALRPAPTSPEPTRPGLRELWARDRAAFGVYVPERTEQGGRALAQNPLYDFLFLDLERAYDPEALRAVVRGVDSSGQAEAPSLLVRIPPISEAGEEATRARVGEVLALGGNGLVIPHIRSLDEARLAIRFVEESGADVWSPANPEGDVILMLMLEDPETVAQARAFAELGGFSVLACGIGSLAGALGGDREAAEAGAHRVLTEARRAGLPDMITANPNSIAGRVEEGYLALLLSGPDADEAIRIGREAAGRE